MWKKKGGSGPAWEEMGGDRRERVRGVTPVIVHFKGGQGYCIWNATAEDEDTMGE